MASLVGHNVKEVVKIAKSEPATHLAGGFGVYRMSDGTLDWFPTGHPPSTVNDAGDVVKDHGATLEARYRTVNQGKTWQKQDITHDE